MKPTFSCIKFLLVVGSFTLLGACAHVEPGQTADPDPLSGWNKPVDSFNNGLDKYLLKPVATTYRGVMPGPAEDAVSQFFDNLGEVSNTTNNLLQGEVGEAGTSLGRLLINSTLGIAGLFEVAESIGLEKEDSEDFGQTLGVWGVESGPYFVLPFLGPSTVRDAPARVVDWFLDPVNWLEEDKVRIPALALDLVQQRADLIDSEGIISGDRYTFIRDAYLQRRDYLVKDGEISGDVDDFLDEDF